MTEQQGRAQRFCGLHVKGEPLILNIWNVGSAKVVSAGGAKAIVTGSWLIAAAHGFGDGERLPLDLMLENLKRIVASVDLPVTCDAESDYGSTPAEVAETAVKVAAAGALGINLEDQVIGGEGLFSTRDQSGRIRAARKAAKSVE